MTPQRDQPQAADTTIQSLPERLCTWCKVPMTKRMVGGGLYIHYICPKCIFQHTSKAPPSPRA